MFKLKTLISEQSELRSGDPIDPLSYEDQVAYALGLSNKVRNSDLQKKPLPKTYKNSAGEKSSLFSEPKDINKFMNWYRKHIEQAIKKDKFGFDALQQLDPPVADSEFHPARTAYWSLMKNNPKWITDFADMTSFFYEYEAVYDPVKQGKLVRDQLKKPSKGYCAELEKNGHTAAAYICRVVTGEASYAEYGYAGLGVILILGYHGIRGGKIKFPYLNRQTTKKFWRYIKGRGESSLAGVYSKWITENPKFMQAHYLQSRKLSDLDKIDDILNRTLVNAEQGVIKNVGANITKRELRAIRRVFRSSKVRAQLKEQLMTDMSSLVRKGYLGSDDFYRLVKNNPSMENEINKINGETWENFGGRTKLQPNGKVHVEVPVDKNGNPMNWTSSQVKQGFFKTHPENQWRKGIYDPTASYGQTAFAKDAGVQTRPDYYTQTFAKKMVPYKTKISFEKFEQLVKQHNLFETQLGSGKTLEELHTKVEAALNKGVPISDNLLNTLTSKEAYVERIQKGYQQRSLPIPSLSSIEGQYDLYQLIGYIK